MVQYMDGLVFAESGSGDLSEKECGCCCARYVLAKCSYAARDGAGLGKPVFGWLQRAEAEYFVELGGES